MNILFLGGIFSPKVEGRVRALSIGGIQNAADALQKAYISGLVSNVDASLLDIINLPFVGSFPRKYREVKFCSSDETAYNGARVHTVGFLNLPLIKHFFRFWGAYSALKLRLASRKTQPHHIICYSMHLPFLLAVAILGKLEPTVKTTLIIPDLPEFMLSKTSFLEQWFRLAFNQLTYSLAEQFDNHVYITEHMTQIFKKKPSIIIEGMIELGSSQSFSECVLRDNILLYTGTLDERYGIKNLVDWFTEYYIGDLVLGICGDGDCRDYILDAELRSSNVIFYGQLSREHTRERQRSARFLINPRNNTGEYTKYSFPSKVIEYFDSGTPVLMYALDGIPAEYYNYCYVIDDVPGGFDLALNRVINDSNASSVGLKAQAFVREEKNCQAQVLRLLNAFL